jgi:hypothetical protein
MVPMKRQFIIYKCPENDALALRCRRDYRKREKNVKKILLDLFADLKVALNRSIILK